MASQSEMTELTRFPELREKVVDVVNSMLRKCVGPTQSMISNLINIELAYINTSHPDFIGKTKEDKEEEEGWLGLKEEEEEDWWWWVAEEEQEE